MRIQGHTHYRSAPIRAVAIVAALALLGASLVLAGCGTTIVSGDKNAIRTVTASGEGKALAAPDTAEMTFGASTSGADAKKVLAAASETADKIVAAVKDAGIPADDIQTTGVNLYPQYDYASSGRATVTGYEGTVSVRVTVRDVTKLGVVIGAASGAGANNIYGPTWSLSEDSDQANDAIEQAIKDAKARATTMASAVGAKVGQVVTVSESAVSSPIVYGDTSIAAEGLGADSVKVEPGNLEVVANVTVTFILE